MMRGKRALDDLDEEIRAHIERETQDNLARGLSPKAARQAARRKFGNLTLVKEQARAVWMPVWLDQLRQDLEYGIRGLRRQPGFTAVAVLTLALGIGANTTAFTIVNAVLLGSLPFDHPEQVMWLDTQDTRGRPRGVSIQDFEDWRAASRAFSRMAIWFTPNLSIAGDGRLPTSYSGGYISAGAFDIVGAHAALGRVFREEDDRPGAEPVVLLGNGVWKSRYAADPTILGQAVHVNTVPATVIGVMPEGFAFPYQFPTTIRLAIGFVSWTTRNPASGHPGRRLSAWRRPSGSVGSKTRRSPIPSSISRMCKT